MQLNFPTILFTLINILLIVGIIAAIFFIFIAIKKAVISLSNTSKSLENIEKQFNKIIDILENDKK